tara:strand:+ start:305 stop:454 length:150 start_codon:yes stop_codon:yes gene_type:complete
VFSQGGGLFGDKMAYNYMKNSNSLKKTEKKQSKSKKKMAKKTYKNKVKY